MNLLEEQTLALAGMFQAAALVDQLAVDGTCNAAAFDCSFDSLFSFNAASTIEIFGDVSKLEQGFEALTLYLGGGRSSKNSTAYYLMSMMKIAKNLLGDRQQAELLAEQLQQIQSDASAFELGRSAVVMKIDRFYQQAISHISPRIVVRGSQALLLDDNNASKIRTLLLAGIRAAVLWHQLGGSKWKIFWCRKEYVAAARGLLYRN